VPEHRLVGVLERARDRGFLGPGPVADHVEHARGLAIAAHPAPARFLDLGAGAGVPGLVLALEWPPARATLVDSRRRACAWLSEAVEELGLARRVKVACGRAEELARREDLRGAFDLVVARLFGPPAVTAECGVGFLAPAGRLVVSEPPEAHGERWPTAELAELGLAGPEIRRWGEVTAAVLTRHAAPDDRWPRRTGVPGKRPLW